MFKFVNDVSFSAVDVGAMTYETPGLIGDALKGFSGLFSRKALKVSSPITTLGGIGIQTLARCHPRPPSIAAKEQAAVLGYTIETATKAISVDGTSSQAVISVGLLASTGKVTP
ncbi:hypothetical protein F5X97DRAFT_81519 [Nemania serpens]|nr:hypothetical protein F5X97DRAFT_81519 [Nemania serpens]